MNVKLSKVKEILRDIRRVTLNEAAIPYLKKKHELLFETYTTTRGEMSPTMPGKIHRAVKYKQRPDNISYLGYPPADKVKVNLGRANFANSPVFYGSGDP